MKPEMAAFLKELADLLEKYKAELFYTNDDDGIHALIGGDPSATRIGFTINGDTSNIRTLISSAVEAKADTPLIPAEKPKETRIMAGFAWERVYDGDYTGADDWLYEAPYKNVVLGIKFNHESAPCVVVTNPRTMLCFDCISMDPNPDLMAQEAIDFAERIFTEPSDRRRRWLFMSAFGRWFRVRQ